jgi:outer membrane protein OmpA-like peptidoglycan-associated protein
MYQRQKTNISKRSILILHDSDSKREILSAYLKSDSENIVIQESHTIAEAEEFINYYQYDIIICNAIFPSYRSLINSETHVIFLIPNKSELVLEEINKQKIKDYLVFPKTEKELREKIEQVSGNNFSRLHSRLNMEEAKSTFSFGSTKIEGHTINVSEGGLLCEFEVDQGFDQILDDFTLTIEFPAKFKLAPIENVCCQFLGTKKTVKIGKKKRIIFSAKVSRNGNNVNRMFQNAIRKIRKGDRPLIHWNNRHLEVYNGGSEVVFFSIVQLIRLGFILITALVIVTLLVYFLWFRDNQTVKIIWSNGTVQYQSSEDKPWENVTGEEYPAHYFFKIMEPLNRVKDQTKQQAVGKIEPIAVFRYGDRSTILLSKSGTLHKNFDDDTINRFLVTGAAHFLLDTTNSLPEGYEINKMRFDTSGSQLFFNDINSMGELSVIQGSLTIAPQLNFFYSLPKDVSSQAGKIKISSDFVIKRKSDHVLGVEKKVSESQYFKETYLPGFSEVGEYKHLGYAELENDQYSLMRYGKSVQVDHQYIPIMLGDTISSLENGKIMLKFHNQDFIRLYANSALTIDEYPLPEKYPLLPLIIGAQTKDLGRIKTIKFNYQGKLRVKANSKLKRRRLKFRSVNALVGVLGTDFETTAQADNVEVLTITGLVDLSDKDEKNTVIVKRGTMSKIEKGKTPEQPQPIPKDRLLKLLSDSIKTAQTLGLSDFNNADLTALKLKPKTAISLFWTEKLSKAMVVIAGINIPIKVDSNTTELELKYEHFSEILAGDYPLKINVEDFNQRKATLDANLRIEPKIAFGNKNIVFEGKIKFEKGKSVIKKESFTLLNDIISFLKQNKNIKNLSVEGYTDSDGSPKLNQKLSTDRANAVKKYLTENGISGNMVSAIGYGQDRPIASNSTETGKETNRRVEFIIK